MSEPTNDELKQALKVQQGKLEELQLYKSEHERLKKELNAALHPEGGGPPAPAFCDLVAYTKVDMQKVRLTREEKRVLHHLAKAWDSFLELDEQHADDQLEFRQAIHRAQHLILKRPTLRINDI